MVNAVVYLVNTLRKGVNNMFTWLRSYFDKRIIKKFRNEFAILGFPLNHVSDNELIDASIRAGEVMSKTGLTTQVAGEGLEAICLQIKQSLEVSHD